MLQAATLAQHSGIIAPFFYKDLIIFSPDKEFIPFRLAFFTEMYDMETDTDKSGSI